MDVYEYIQILSYVASMFAALFFASIVLTPSTVRKLIGAKLMRRRAAVGFMTGDAGEVYIDMLSQVKGEKGYVAGLFYGDRSGYVAVSTRTSDVGMKYKVEEDGEERDLTHDEKGAMDELIQKRHIMDFFGFPVYFGYMGKCYAATPSLLASMQGHRKGRKETLTEATLLSISALKSYIPWTLNPSIIDAIEWKSEQVGFLGRPPSQVLKQMGLPIAAIVLILGIMYFLTTKGYIQL